MDKYESFIDNLKRDKARGNIAPHQIILLITFLNLASSLAKNHYNIDELVEEFDGNWIKYSHLFSTKNNNIGMPLKALLNRNLVEINVKEPVVNFRNRGEILARIVDVKLSQELIAFLTAVNVQYLEKRIAT